MQKLYIYISRHLKHSQMVYSKYLNKILILDQNKEVNQINWEKETLHDFFEDFSDCITSTPSRAFN